MAGCATVTPLRMKRSQTEGQLYNNHKQMYTSQPKKKRKKQVTIAEEPVTLINNNPSIEYDYEEDLIQEDEASRKARRVRSNSAPIVIEIPPEPKVPQTYFTLAGVVTLCFNCPIGFIAVLFSKSAFNNYKNGNVQKAKVQARVAFVLSMTGVIVTMGVVIFVVIIALRQKSVT